MSDKKLVHAIWGAAGSGIAAAASAVLLLLILWDTNHRQGRHNSYWLAYYAEAVAQTLEYPGALDDDGRLLRLLAVPELQSACLFLGANLHLETGGKCPAHMRASEPQIPAALTLYTPFTTADGQTGHLLLTAADQRPPLAPALGLVSALVIALASCAFFLARAHVLRQQQQLQLQPMEELKNLFQTLHRTQNYRLRAPAYVQPPYSIIAEVLNQMLDELQANENQIHEFAVQIQEKNDHLAAQKRLHHDRNQNLQKMFAGASHDLRQPLQAMMIFITAIKEHATAQQEPLLQKLEQVMDNLNHLFTDLLDISKLESRMTRIPKHNLAIKPLLSKIYDEFEALANEKKIELRLYNRDLTVYSNPNMLERIIRNMISNAIRYTRTGGVLIGCRKRANAVWIEVWDTGRGIPQEKMGEIFTEFVQLKEGDSEPNKGVGLGLFIVKRLAQLLDHSIIVTSQLKRGTMFRIVAPSQVARSAGLPEVAGALAPRAPVTALPAGPLTLVQPTRLPRRILLLDDEEQIRIALKHLLKSWGCDVDDWAHLEEALQHLQNHDPVYDLMISDFQLEEQLNGLDAIAAVRRQLDVDLPALLITGTQDPRLLQAIEASEVPYLRKPVRPAKLRALLQALGTDPAGASIQ